MMGKYKLDLIGPFGLFTPNGDRIEITSKKAIALIALLVSSPSGARSRRWLQTMLWGTRENEQAQTSLRRELSNLAKVLSRHGADALLIRGMQRVGLAIDQLDIDVFSLGVGDPLIPGNQAGDFLEGIDLPDCEEFEEWLRDERNRIRDLIGSALNSAAAPAPSARDVLGMALPSTSDVLSNRPPHLPPKPSVAVLPFVELSPECGGWLGVGLADEVGVILSQFPQLFIVASSAARAVASEVSSRAEIAARLGVRYLLEGTVIRQGDDLRVAVMLIEGSTGEQVWAEKFGGRIGQGFELQDAIATSIAPRIWSKVDISERQRVLRRTGPATGNYEVYWRANALFRSWSRDDVFEAIDLSEQLVANDPTCPWSASLAGYCHSTAFMMGYAADRQATRRRAILHYQSAIRYGEDNVEALGYAAGTLVNIGGDLLVADRLVAHAMALLPAHPPTYFWGGWVDVQLGNGARARERFELALRLNPATSVRQQTLSGIGFSCLLQDQPEEAYAFFREANFGNDDLSPWLIGLCAAAAMIGDTATVQTIKARVPDEVLRASVDMFVAPTLNKRLRVAIDSVPA